MVKKFLFVCAFLLVASAAQAQVYTDDTPSGGMVVPPPGPARYRLRNAYPVYPAGPVTSPDTAEVGRPYYYGGPYGYPGGPYGTYPGVTSDGNSVYVPGN
ncbi:MAG: hypothetical protein K8R69_04005 [Deltaproteobacteria bacterium]|nr:hypothetical protein [Deltaproteobacteria bacterium]